MCLSVLRSSRFCKRNGSPCVGYVYFGVGFVNASSIDIKKGKRARKRPFSKSIYATFHNSGGGRPHALQPFFLTHTSPLSYGAPKKKMCVSYVIDSYTILKAVLTLYMYVCTTVPKIRRVDTTMTVVLAWRVSFFCTSSNIYQARR